MENFKRQVKPKKKWKRVDNDLGELEKMMNRKPPKKSKPLATQPCPNPKCRGTGKFGARCYDTDWYKCGACSLQFHRVEESTRGKGITREDVENDANHAEGEDDMTTNANAKKADSNGEHTKKKVSAPPVGKKTAGRVIDKPATRPVLSASAVKKPESKAKASAPAPKKGDMLSKKITLLEKTNPKRPGSDSFKRYAKYKTGMTVEAFVDAGGTLADVRHDSGHDFIKLS